MKSVNTKIRNSPFIMEMSLLKSDWCTDLQVTCECTDCFSFFQPSLRYIGLDALERICCERWLAGTQSLLS